MAVPLNEQLKIILKTIKEPGVLKALLSLRHSGYLVDIGWFNSFINKSPVDADNKPVPWVTYPFIDFITPRLNKKLKVFEYGAGNSTLFYAKYAGKVTTVEHNQSWYQKIKNELPENAEIILCEVESNEYEKAAANTDETYDLIIIDAEKRIECLKASVEQLTENGVLILDDSERKEYADAFSFMREKGFKNLDFWGISPGYFNRKCTTIFYKSNNCLGI